MLALFAAAVALAAVPESTLQALSGKTVLLTDDAGAQISGEITAVSGGNVVLITAAGDVLTVPAGRVSAVRVQSAAPSAAPSFDAPPGGSTYEEGRIDGRADAKDDARNVLIPGLAGFGAGAFCGLIGVPIVAVSYAVAKAEPRSGPWIDEPQAYQDGYIDGYSQTVRRRRLAAAVGTSLVVGSASTALALAL